MQTPFCLLPLLFQAAFLYGERDHRHSSIHPFIHSFQGPPPFIHSPTRCANHSKSPWDSPGSAGDPSSHALGRKPAVGTRPRLTWFPVAGRSADAGDRLGSSLAGGGAADAEADSSRAVAAEPARVPVVRVTGEDSEDGIWGEEKGSLAAHHIPGSSRNSHENKSSFLLLGVGMGGYGFLRV